MKKSPAPAVEPWQELSRARWCAVVVGSCLSMAVLCTWPLALHLATALPLGTETAATVPLFDVWTLWWSGDRFAHAYAGVWDAPIFHPSRAAFAFLEPMLLPGAVAWPLFALHAPPALCHNLILLALLLAAGIGACRLARAVGGARPAALAGGMMTIALPFLAKMQGELPILGIAGTLLALDALVRFGATGRTGYAWGAAAGTVIQLLTCLQLALFSLFFVGAAALVAWGQHRFSRAAAARLGAAGIATMLVFLLVTAAPRSAYHQQEFTRTAELVQSLSAQAADFMSRPAGAAFPFPAPADNEQFTAGLFPGLLVAALALLGALSGAPTRDMARWRWYAVGASLFGALLALGLNLSIFGWRPFATLRALGPFSAVRSVFRCALFMQLHLVLLATLGLGALMRRVLSGRGLRLRLLSTVPLLGTATIALGTLAAVENLSVPARLISVPASPRTAWSAYLAEQPANTVVAHVPFSATGNVEDLEPEAWRMYAQIDHGRPLVNGYSSNFPALHREFMFAMGANFPHHALACALRLVFGTDLLVADENWLARMGPRMAVLTTMLRPAYHDDLVTIFQLRPTTEECPPMRVDLGPH